MANHTLTVITSPHRSDVEGRSSPAMLVRRIGRDAIRLTWKPARSTRIAADVQMALTWCVSTTGTGKGFVDAMKIIRGF